MTGVVLIVFYLEETAHKIYCGDFFFFPIFRILGVKRKLYGIVHTFTQFIHQQMHIY